MPTMKRDHARERPLKLTSSEPAYTMRGLASSGIRVSISSVTDLHELCASSGVCGMLVCCRHMKEVEYLDRVSLTCSASKCSRPFHQRPQRLLGSCIRNAQASV